MYFFIQYVLILVVCLFQGVVVLPVVLSLIGPHAFKPPDGSAPRGEDSEARLTDQELKEKELTML